MSEVIKITEEQGEELAEYGYFSNGGGDPIEIDGHTYTYEDVQEDVEDHRWNTTHLNVFKREDGKLFGMLYDIGLTEGQENGFVYNVPELYEVDRSEKTTVVISYEKVA